MQLLNTAMAETNARREARRRRILENSEDRLRKITARGNPDGIEDNSPPIKSNIVKVESNVEEYNIRNGICNINRETKLQDHTRFINNEVIEHESFLNDSNDGNACLSEQISKSKLMSCTLFCNRINLILLAGIVNILLELKQGNLFGQTIIIPYCLLMLGRLCTCKKLHEVQDGSLLIAALMLCNIKPKLIYRFKVSLTLFSIIFNDFGLYMFSFVLMHYVITCYYHYTATISVSA